MWKYDLYGGLRDAELSIEKLNALARETASRAVREGKSAFYRANARAAKDDRRAIEDANAALEAANGSGTELPVGADEFADSFYIIEKAAGEAENYARELGALPLRESRSSIRSHSAYSSRSRSIVISRSAAAGFCSSSSFAVIASLRRLFFGIAHSFSAAASAAAYCLARMHMLSASSRSCRTSAKLSMPISARTSRILSGLTA